MLFPNLPSSLIAFADLQDASATLLQDIGTSIVAATALAYVARLTRQPLLLGYIVAGVVVGPSGLGWVHSEQSIQRLAELGLTFLMFIVGLELDVNKIIETGRKVAPTTTVQVLASTLLGWLAALALGYSGLPAVYVAAAVATSSTMIVLKILADRNEMYTASGQMTLGIMVLQDLFAIVALAMQPSLGEGVPVSKIALTTFYGLAMVGGAIVSTRYILPFVFRFVAKSPEVLLLTSVSWCFLVCYAAIRLEFSVALGAMMAGASLSAFPYSMDVVAKVRGLRDFFVPLFFVSLGMMLTRPTADQILIVLVLTILVILTRYLTIWPMLKFAGYDHKIGIMSSSHLSQISELGLVLAMTGVALGHIDKNQVSVIVLLMIVSATLSTYLVRYSHVLSQRLLRQKVSQQTGDASQSTVLVESDGPPAIMLIGCFRIGSSLVHELRQATINFSVIDFNQTVNQRLNALGVSTTYGDISHLDTLEHAGVEHAKILIVGVGDDFLRGTDNARLLQQLRRVNPTAKIIVTSDSIEKALRLYEAGADYVLLQRVLSARHLMEVIAELGAGMLETRRESEIDDLRRRVEVVP